VLLQNISCSSCHSASGDVIAANINIQGSTR
jgi:hypothetical protein